jgi:peptide/nickel transport system substrate-binding protein
MDYALQVEPMPYDPQKAKQLLAEAGYPNGLDAGELVPIPPFFDVAEAAVNYLNAGGIRVRMRTMERAPFLSAWREKRLRGLFLTAAGASGNAATRVEAFIYSKGAFAYGGYPDIDELCQQQARERDRAKREALSFRNHSVSRGRHSTKDGRFANRPYKASPALIGGGGKVPMGWFNAIEMRLSAKTQQT